MARIVKNEQEWHLLTICSDGGSGTLRLSMDARGPYLWCDGVEFSGPATLRKLAKAILKEAGE